MKKQGKPKTTNAYIVLPFGTVKIISPIASPIIQDGTIPGQKFLVQFAARLWEKGFTLNEITIS